MCKRDLDSDMSDILGDESGVDGSSGPARLPVVEQQSDLSPAELIAELDSEELDSESSNSCVFIVTVSG